MAIEIRTFDGSPQELAEFCVSCWRQTYEGTNMPFAMWTGSFMDWENFEPHHDDRHFLVAAYDGGKLVGALPARPVPFILNGEPVNGTISSYFSVDREYTQQGVALKLNLEQRRRHRQRDAAFMLGYIYTGASAAQGKEYWLRQPRNVKVTGKVGLWARILDHRKVSQFERVTFDKWGARALGLVQGAPRGTELDAGIRPYEAEDLTDCLPLAKQLGRDCEFTYAWPVEQLQRQLEFPGVTQTLVAEQQGRVVAFLNYCHLNFRHIDEAGDHQIQAGVIDLLALGDSPGRLRSALIRSALRQMATNGCHVALMLRTACYPYWRLLRHGFVAQPAAYAVSLTEMSKLKAPERLDRLHVHWR